jgi:hypothetical protein
MEQKQPLTTRTTNIYVSFHRAFLLVQEIFVSFSGLFMSLSVLAVSINNGKVPFREHEEHRAAPELKRFCLNT